MHRTDVNVEGSFSYLVGIELSAAVYIERLEDLGVPLPVERGDELCKLVEVNRSAAVFVIRIEHLVDLAQRRR